jgi:hypothetical protein
MDMPLHGESNIQPAIEPFLATTFETAEGIEEIYIIQEPTRPSMWYSSLTKQYTTDTATNALETLINGIKNTDASYGLVRALSLYGTDIQHTGPYDETCQEYVDLVLVFYNVLNYQCLWAANNGNFGSTDGASVAETFTQTITLTPDLVDQNLRLISWQKSHHTGTPDYDKWGYFYGDNITIQPFSLATPTSQNDEIEGTQPWHPTITTSENRLHEKQYQVQGYTDWLPETQTWTPPIIGTYTFQVRLGSKDPNWDDSDPSGTYNLKVNKPSIPLEIQTPIEVTIAPGDTYIPDLSHSDNNDKNVSTYQLEALNQNFKINVPIDQLKWKPPLPGTYTLTLQHMGETIGNTEYLESKLVTIILHVTTEIPLSIQIDQTVSMPLGESFDPIVHANFSDNHYYIGSYKFTVDGIANLLTPDQFLSCGFWTPTTEGTYTLTLQHRAPTDSLDGIRYLDSEQKTITATVVKDHPPTVALKRCSDTEPGIIPNGHYTYAGDTITIEISFTDPDHDHELFNYNLMYINYVVDAPDKLQTDVEIWNLNLDSKGTGTARFNITLQNPGTYRVRAQAFDYLGQNASEDFIITVTEPYAFYRITASAKPAKGLEAWFTPSGTTQQIIKLPRPRGPIQTQPNP